MRFDPQIMKSFIVYSSLGIMVFLFSCRKDKQFLTSQGTLNFTKDTVYFDTVFTRLANSNYPRSINKQFKIKNPYNKTVTVNAKVMGGSGSSYRFNVDGRFGAEIKGIDILPKDSTWVFVECTLEPNNTLNPILVRDSLSFETNGNVQFVQLAAYGWDAYYYKDTVFDQNTLIDKTDKPHVIVNTAFVNIGNTLTIGAGVHFYSTANSTFVNNKNKIISIGALNVLGTLVINGTKASPVIFEGDRLYKDFDNKGGQWRGIRFYRGSINNTINFTEIKNATTGITVDSLPENSNPNLVVTNSKVYNMSAYGIVGVTAKINLTNVLIYNCGVRSFFAVYGGEYIINHCTFYCGGGRRDPHVIFNNQLRNDNNVVIKTFDIGFSIVNSIIWGPNKTELFFDLNKNTTPNPYYPSHNIIKSEIAITGVNLKLNADPKFKNIEKNDFKLKLDSPALNSADASFPVLLDIEENPRVGIPDLGAYEFQ